MPRYTFKTEDLAPLRRVIERPDVQRLLARAIPVKTFDVAPPKVVDVVTDPLPIRLRNAANPNGVPLGDVNDLVKSRVPGVRSVIVRDNAVLVQWLKEPSDADRANVKAAFSDQKAFQAILDNRATPDPEVINQKLQDPAVPDIEWIKAFRQQHMANTRLRADVLTTTTMTPDTTPLVKK